MLSRGQLKWTCAKNIFDLNQKVDLKANYILTISTQEIFSQKQKTASNIMSYTEVWIVILTALERLGFTNRKSTNAEDISRTQIEVGVRIINVYYLAYNTTTLKLFLSRMSLFFANTKVLKS